MNLLGLRHFRSIVAPGTLAAILFLAPSATAQTNPSPSVPARKPDVIYVPTPRPVVEKMLEMAAIKEGDVVYDLGCGDGRIVVAAAKKYGVKAVGVDIDPQRVKEARENARTNNVEHLISIVEADLFTLDLSEASVVTLYLLPELNVHLMPQLAKLKPGSRIVSHNYAMRGAKPVEVVRMRIDLTRTRDDRDPYFGDGLHTIYKWVVPWESESSQHEAAENVPAPATASPAAGTNARAQLKPQEQ